MKIAFMACEATLPGAVDRRIDAYEHDHQVAALRPHLRDLGANLLEIDWCAPLEEFKTFDGALIGTTWDYQDRREEFLDKLVSIETSGVKLFNSSSLIRWNITKTYLKDLDAKGVRTIPTLWIDKPSLADVDDAFDRFETEKLVIKRQVGAGAEGQRLLFRNSSPPIEKLAERPAMIQPFLPSIQDEGEYSFIFIEGVFSHALLKTAAAGDYRIQSAFGGRETAVKPNEGDLSAAQAVVNAFPENNPLYARIDMVRDSDGGLVLMEAELIEPYLYPLEGPEMGERMAKAIIARLA